jgi:MFS family permease
MEATADLTRHSAWTPLRVATFRTLWLAQLGGMVGTWMQTVGAQWLLVESSGAEALVALVQVAAMMPVLMLAVPAGALADIVDRRRLLIGVQVFQVCVAGALTALTAVERMTPQLLLALTFLIGCGAAVTLSAYAVLLQELVPRSQMRAAAALNGVAMNTARAVGPAIAGLIIGWVGPAAVFGLNALSFVVVAVTLITVRPPPQTGRSDELPERFLGAVRAGARYVRHSPVVRRMLLRAALFVFPGAALWALLPVVANRRLGLGATGYGLMMAALGVGAVLAADVLPRLGSLLSANRLLLAAGMVFAAVLAVCVLVPNAVVVVLALVPAGMAWLGVVAGISGTLQAFLPNWVRARGVAVYAVVFAGGQAIGAVVWGLVAQWWGVAAAFGSAAALMAAGTATVVRWPLRDVTGWNREPQVYWPEPDLHMEPDPDEGPVVVTATYSVAEDRAEEFIDAMATLRLVKLRTGATSSALYRDGADPTRFVDISEYPTWAEHLRQHTGRLTGTDRSREARAHTLADGPPDVAHLFPARASS